MGDFARFSYIQSFIRCTSLTVVWFRRMKQGVSFVRLSQLFVTFTLKDFVIVI